jgi:hypothetical protein
MLMIVAIDEYQRLIETFLEAVLRLQGDLVGVLLYGSVARNAIRPGISDLLDAYVVLDENMFVEAERYEQDLLILIESCMPLAHSGIPFHPVHYYTATELEYLQPAVYLPTLQQPGFSRVLVGRDIRSEIGTSANSRLCAQTEFYSFHRYVMSLGSLAIRKDLTEYERSMIVAAVMKTYKKMPMLACLAMDRWVEQSEGRRVLQEILPSLDMTVLDGLDAMDIPHLKLNDLQTEFGRVLDLVDNVNLALKSLRKA